MRCTQRASAARGWRHRAAAQHPPSADVCMLARSVPRFTAHRRRRFHACQVGAGSGAPQRQCARPGARSAPARRGARLAGAAPHGACGASTDGSQKRQRAPCTASAPSVRQTCAPGPRRVPDSLPRRQPARACPRAPRPHHAGEPVRLAPSPRLPGEAVPALRVAALRLAPLGHHVHLAGRPWVRNRRPPDISAPRAAGGTRTMPSSACGLHRSGRSPGKPYSGRFLQPAAAHILLATSACERASGVARRGRAAGLWAARRRAWRGRRTIPASLCALHRRARSPGKP